MTGPAIPFWGHRGRTPSSARVLRMRFVDRRVAQTLIGGALGVGTGAAITAAWATHREWQVTVPAVARSLVAAVAVGAVAGLYPTLRAVGVAPTEALRGS